MGIQGLLPLLDKASRPANISEFSGFTVAIDSYCWLHKGAFSCAEKLARGEKCDQFVKFCMKFVHMLLSFNIKPILVFDGRHLPAKAETEKKRRETRENNRRKAAELLRLEKTSEAHRLLQRSVDVTHEMALSLIKECHTLGVDCIVAPFEADAQLAYLNLNGFAQVVITEDSDLLLFGCKLVLFKMDVYGNGVLIEQSKIPLALTMHPNQFTMDKFRYLCILSGCDYLKSLPGIGLAKALKFIKKTQDDNISRALTRLGAYLNMPNLVVSANYREKFLEAVAMFKHQPVFDPRSRSIVPLTPVPPGEPNPLLSSLEPQIALQLALGNINPFSLAKVDSWDPDQLQQKIQANGCKGSSHRHPSIWSKDYKLPKPLSVSAPQVTKHPDLSRKTVPQSVSLLSQKILNIPRTTSLECELSQLRDSFGVKLPPSKRQCLDEAGDSGISSSGEVTPVNSEELLTPLIEDSEQPADDGILGTQSHSPILVGSQWKQPCPFKTPTQQRESAQRSTVGALDVFSKLKKTAVETSCIVKSRYFRNSETEEPSPSQLNSNYLEDRTAESVFEIIESTPSPKKNGLSVLLNKKALSTPRRNLFQVSTEEKHKQKGSPCLSLGSKSPAKGSPAKNIFIETSQNVSSEKFQPLGSELFQKECKDTSEDGKRLLRGNQVNSCFKWSGPLVNDLKRNGAQKSPPEGSRTRPSLPLQTSKTPKGRPKKEVGSSFRNRSVVDNNATFKKKPSSSPNQTTLFSMYAFQPKSKLKLQ